MQAVLANATAQTTSVPVSSRRSAPLTPAQAEAQRLQQLAKTQEKEKEKDKERDTGKGGRSGGSGSGKDGSAKAEDVKRAENKLGEEQGGKEDRTEEDPNDKDHTRGNEEDGDNMYVKETTPGIISFLDPTISKLPQISSLQAQVNNYSIIYTYISTVNYYCIIIQCIENGIRVDSFCKFIAHFLVFVNLCYCYGNFYLLI